MPVKLLNLDDRTFADLVEEERLLIPRFARPWTDHNVSDPGIMVIELFAWLTEALLYRINRVSDSSRMRLLELLGASFRPAEPAVLELRVKWQGGHCTLQRGSRIQVDRGAAKPVVFEIMDDLTFTSQQHVRTITARQTERTASRELAQRSDDGKLQLFRLEDGFFVPPATRRQRLPQVTVDGKPWMYKPYLRESQAADAHFTYKPWLESIAFGDGRTGAIPPAEAPIVITYQPDPARQRIVTEDFTSQGRPWQTHRLSRPLQLSETAQPSDLEPNLEILDPKPEIPDPKEPEKGVPWEFVPRFLDMAAEALQYTVEPWQNAIRFGNGIYGKVPVLGARVRIAYHQTLGAEGNIPVKSDKFSFWIDPNADEAPGTGLWQQVEKLKVLSWRIVSPGRNPTTLDEARDAVFALLEPGWRAATGDDFVSIVRKNHPGVARAVCLPDHDPAEPESVATRPGHVGIIAVPSPIGELTKDASALHRIEGLAPDGLHLVASAIDGATWLWDVGSRQALARLGRVRPVRLTFSSSGRHLVVVPAHGAAALWDTHLGSRVAFLEKSLRSRADAVPAKKRDKNAQPLTEQPSLSHVVFDPNSLHVATVAADGTAILRKVDDGFLLKELGVASPGVAPVFSPDGRLLATAQRDQTVALWCVPINRPPVTVQLGAPASHVVFSPDGTRLAVATTDARVRLQHIRPADGAVYEEQTLQLGQAVEELLFDRSGQRLATRGAEGEAILWSTRTGARQADLSQPGAVDRLVFNGDGSRLATAQRDQTIHCWNAADGHEVVTLSEKMPVEDMIFSPSGQRLTVISTSAEQTILLKAWDLRGDRALSAGTYPLAGSHSAIVHVSGKWLAYSDDHLVHIWDIERGRDITAVYADFDDPGVQAAGWRLVTPDDPAEILLGDHQEKVRPARGPYVWIMSAVGNNVTQRTVQVLDAEHLYRVDATLAARRLVTSQHHVEGPVYTNVSISLKVVRRSSATSQPRVASEIEQALTRFFDPLHGGPDGTGWPLGRSVYASEVYQVVEGVAAVDHVKDLVLSPVKTKEQKDVTIRSRSLVTFDVHVEVE